MEECCRDENPCSQEEYSPNRLLSHINSALWHARGMKEQRGVGGREVAETVTQLEYALFRAEQYQRELESCVGTEPCPAPAEESCSAVGC